MLLLLACSLRSTGISVCRTIFKFRGASRLSNPQKEAIKVLLNERELGWTLVGMTYDPLR